MKSVSNPNPQFLSPVRAAKFIGVSRRTIYVWMNKNRLPYFLTPSGRRLVRAADLVSPKAMEN